jgi:hypothetical protein
MSTPYIEVGPSWIYNVMPNNDDDFFWIVTKDEDGEETARAMFFYLEDAKEYLRKAKGIPLEDIKIVKED